jgi:DNA-binding response OmpR family regulator
MNSSHRVLYVEDDPDSAEVLQIALEMDGFEVVCCPTSEEGLRHAQGGGFLAIILDHWLPDITGVDVCREIRTFDQQTVIIIYSAAAYRADIEEGLEAGANYYFVKPMDFSKVRESIAKLIS